MTIEQQNTKKASDEANGLNHLDRIQPRYDTYSCLCRKQTKWHTTYKKCISTGHTFKRVIIHGLRTNSGGGKPQTMSR